MFIVTDLVSLIPEPTRDQTRHLYFYCSIEDVNGISIFAYKNFIDVNIFRFVIYAYN